MSKSRAAPARTGSAGRSTCRASILVFIAALSAGPGWLAIPAFAAHGDRHATAGTPTRRERGLDKVSSPAASPRRTLLASCLPPPALTFPGVESVDRPLMAKLRESTVKFIAGEDEFQSCIIRYIHHFGTDWPDQSQYAEYHAAADALLSESQTRKENVGLAFNQLAMAFHMKTQPGP